MKVVNMSMLSPSILHVPRVVVKQWTYLGILLVLTCFEAHSKDKQECSFIYMRWTVIKF